MFFNEFKQGAILTFREGKAVCVVPILYVIVSIIRLYFRQRNPPVRP